MSTDIPAALLGRFQQGDTLDEFCLLSHEARDALVDHLAELQKDAPATDTLLLSVKRNSEVFFAVFRLAWTLVNLFVFLCLFHRKHARCLIR